MRTENAREMTDNTPVATAFPDTFTRSSIPSVKNHHNQMVCLLLTSVAPLRRGRDFAFVTFNDDGAARDAIKVGVEFDGGVKPRVQASKLLCKEVLTWRADIRSKFAALKETRDALPSADPTDQSNAGNNFRAMYGDMVVARKA